MYGTCQALTHCAASRQKETPEDLMKLGKICIVSKALRNVDRCTTTALDLRKKLSAFLKVTI